MTDIATTIETLETRLMRAWINASSQELKKLLARDFLMIAGHENSQLLDRPSFIEATKGGLACRAFRFRDVHVRKHGATVWFTAGCELEMTLQSKDWSGHFWLTDLWRKSRIKRSWVLAERSIARSESDDTVSAGLHQLQLWR